MSKRLLLADDSITIQKVIQITFAHEDYQLTITDNGDTALARAREQSPDLVLADVYMPGKNGYELCAAIKQTPGLQHVPVLLLAGSFEPFDEAKARAAGADAWIEKPFESQALIDKVATLLAAAPAVVVAPLPPPPVTRPEPVVAQPDPFADIRFPAPPVPVSPTLTAPDDWSDLNESPAISIVAPVAAPPVFVTAPAAVPNFEFDDEAFVVPVQEPPVPASDFIAFDDGEEIMALGDDDILASEDLEPLGELPTLAPWSREEFPPEEPFETFDEPLPPPPPQAVVQPPPAPPAAPPTPADLPPAPATPAAPPVAAADQRVAMLTEGEIEQIVERAVGKVIERLAGTVLERVAWEVVPDLAEALIKEEIRKIKDAAA